MGHILWQIASLCALVFYMMISSLNGGCEDSYILKSPSLCKIHRKYSTNASVLWEPLHMDPRAVKDETVDVNDFSRGSRKQLSETKTISSLMGPGLFVSPYDSIFHTSLFPWSSLRFLQSNLWLYRSCRSLTSWL